MKDARGIELVEGDHIIRVESMNGRVTLGVFLREHETRKGVAVILNLKTDRENISYKAMTYKVPKV